MKHILITTIAAVLVVGCGPSESVLRSAASDGNIEAVKRQLAAGANVNAPDTYGYTSLHKAAENGHKEIVELLIAKGADVNAKNKYEQTPLHRAAYRGRKEIAELLIAKGADVNALSVLLAAVPNGKTPLDWAIEYKRTETAELLRKHGGKTKEWLNADNSIHDAASAGHIEAIKQHLAAGTDVNTTDRMRRTPLLEAATGGRTEVAELLLAKGADVNALSVYGTPLDRAVERDQTETVALLRKHGGKTKKELKVAESIHAAASDGNIEAVKQHLAAGADVNAKGKGYGRTPLNWAAYRGHKEIVELLIAEGADVNAKDKYGGTPLDAAIQSRKFPKGHPEVADLLRKHGGKTGEELKAEGK